MCVRDILYAEVPDVVSIKCYVTYKKKKFFQLGDLRWGHLGWIKDQIPPVLSTKDTNLLQKKTLSIWRYMKIQTYYNKYIY